MHAVTCSVMTPADQSAARPGAEPVHIVMYLDYFDLSERPFSITPDPRFLYMSARHREALAHLLYGLGEGGGFVQLTGEVGTGKTTMCRCLLEQVPEHVEIAVVLNPKVTASELIATVLDELGVSYPPESASIKTLIDILNRNLLDAHARGRRTVLIIDEAQNLSADVLEQIRLLTNLETATQKLLQIILIGQPELRDLLAREDMRQLAQRVTARYHLEPISREETDAYIRHRLQICGTSKLLFNKGAVDHIQQLTAGIPRLINVLCDRAMLGAYVEGKPQVDRKVVRKAAREVLADTRPGSESTSNYLLWLLTGCAVLALAVLGYLYQPWQTRPAPAPVPAVAAPAGRPGPVTTAPAGLAAVPEQEGLAGDATGALVPAQVASAAATPAPQPDTRPQPVALEPLLAEADSSWYRAAWAKLLALWAVALPDDANPDFCDYALQYGLLCAPGQGNWNTLRQYNRPAILKLAAPDGSRVPVLLRQLDGSRAEIVMGDTAVTSSVERVDAAWYGEYVLLLQAPPGGRLYLKMGDRSPDVQWLREQLEQIQGVKLLAPDPLSFDFPLQKQVLEFQRSHGLQADGVVGKNTLIQLNTSAGREGVPVLYSGPGD